MASLSPSSSSPARGRDVAVALAVLAAILVGGYYLSLIVLALAPLLVVGAIAGVRSRARGRRGGGILEELLAGMAGFVLGRRSTPHRSVARARPVKVAGETYESPAAARREVFRILEELGNTPNGTAAWYAMAGHALELWLAAAEAEGAP